MSYPLQVPPGWRKGEPVHAIGTGPRYAVMRGTGELFEGSPNEPVPADECALEFDSRKDCVAWLKWWVTV